MAKQQSNKKLDPKKPKFSAYWIYALIILIFLGINFFGGSGFGEPAKITPSDYMKYLSEGDVKKTEVINERVARVYLTSEAKEKAVHKKSGDSDFLKSMSGTWREPVRLCVSRIAFPRSEPRRPWRAPVRSP